MSDHEPLDNFNIGTDPSIVERIQYDITKSEAGCLVPPFTYHISPSSSFEAAYTNALSDLALVLSNSRTIQRVSGTDLSIMIPNLMDNHILIVFPPALPNTDPTTLIVHIYAIEVDPDHLLTSEEIVSCLERLDQSSPLYKSLVSVDYKLGVYRRGEGYDTEVLQTGEYNAGSILYLIESSNDEASASSLILRGSAPGKYVGACCVAILSSNGPVPFSDSRMDEEPTLTEERKEENIEEELVGPAYDMSIKRKGIEEENMSLGPRETLPEQYHTVDEKETEKETSVQEKAELTVTNLSISNPEGGIVLLQNPSPILNSTITQLSSSNHTPTYSPSAPISDTDKYPTAPLKQKHFFQPSITPCKQVVTRDQDFPETIAEMEHGALIYAKGFVKDLVSGNFSTLPKCEHLAQYDQLGKGGNGKVIPYFIGGHKVALKYIVRTAGYCRKTLEIWSQLDHPNITPLLGAFVVHSLNQRHYCQVMPRMTRSLRDEFEIIGGGIMPALKLGKITPKTLWRNFRIVCRQVLQALDYLQKRGIALLDLKSSNMLTMQEHCQCESIFECPEGHHYSVKLADFDFVCSSSSTFTKCPQHPIEKKGDEELCRISGTPRYRVAPERACKNCGCEGVNVIGPWNDMWSFSVFLLDELNGRFDKNNTTAEAKMLSGDFKGNSSRFDPNNCSYTAEVNSLLLTRIDLSREPKNEMVNGVLQMIDACCKADCTERATAADLLRFPFFSY